MAWLASYVCDVTRIVANGGKVRFHHMLLFMTKQRAQFGCGYLQTAQEVTESLIPISNHSRTSIAATKHIVSFSRHSCSRRDARVDKSMPKEWLLGKVTSKIQMYCIEQNRKYLHSVVISLLKLEESHSFGINGRKSFFWHEYRLKQDRKSKLQRNHQWYSTYRRNIMFVF